MQREVATSVDTLKQIVACIVLCYFGKGCSKGHFYVLYQKRNEIHTYRLASYASCNIRFGNYQKPSTDLRMISVLPLLQQVGSFEGVEKRHRLTSTSWSQ